MMQGQGAPVEAPREVYALEGELKIHPKFLFKHYLAGFGAGQECALFGPGLEDITPGGWIRVEGTLGTRFSSGGTATNPSPFGRTCFIYMDVTKIEVLHGPSAEAPPPNLPPVVGGRIK
jgi:hypothetical protein